jgi:hypothetical protein
MKLLDTFSSEGYEHKLHETRSERQSETKHLERLSDILTKKLDSVKRNARLVRVA